MTNVKEDFPVRFTDAAINTVKAAIEEEGLSEQHGVRVAVRGGGCSGLGYSLDFDNEIRIGDNSIVVDGLKIFVDMASAHFLKGTVIDYVTDGDESGFKFENPNPVRKCSCGH